MSRIKKTIFILFIFFSIFLACLYISTSFVLWEINPYKWGESIRAMVAFIPMFLAIFLFALTDRG